MSKTSDWMIDITDKTAELMVTMGGSRIDKREAYEMAEREMQRVDHDCTRFDVNALVDEAMELDGRTARTRWLNRMRWKFDEYMRYEMWDKMTYVGIYEDDAWHAIGAFVEFCEKGYVTDDEGHPLFVDAQDDVRDFDAACNLMDGELREELHRTMCHSTPQEFIEAYAKRHQEKFGEGFVPYEGGNW